MQKGTIEVQCFPKTMIKLGAKLLSNAKGNNGETVEHKDCNQRQSAADL